jgi:hypothetical protein
LACPYSDTLQVRARALLTRQLQPKVLPQRLSSLAVAAVDQVEEHRALAESRARVAASKAEAVTTVIPTTAIPRAGAIAIATTWLIIVTIGRERKRVAIL